MELKFVKRRFFNCVMVLAISLFSSNNVSIGAEVLKLATTTSTENSGLLDVLLPEFTKETNIQVKVFAKGTGAAIRDGEDGNVDVIFVHAREREENFVSQGYGAYRFGVMHNDFLILGPASDPAGIKGIYEASVSFSKIAMTKSRFVSRGDDSGTHTKELEIWQTTGIPLKKTNTQIIKGGEKKNLSFSHPEGLGDWYFSIGQGMGNALTYAEEKQAYILTDRGTYLKYRYGRKQGLDLEVLCQGDPMLFNPYGIIPISAIKHPHVRFDLADRFAKWLISPKAQDLIGNYKIHGMPAFYPDAVHANN